MNPPATTPNSVWEALLPEGVPLVPEYVPNLDELVTEDHRPVDRISIEKQYRLLGGALYASWSGPPDGQPFLLLVNVGWFYKDRTPPVVPDCLLSLGVSCPEDLHVKAGHSYYQWLVGKQPEVVIEIISDNLGGEETHKKNLYAELSVLFYAVFDPERIIHEEVLTVYELRRKKYHRIEPGYWPEIGLGLVLWEGTFENHHDTWLRWCDEHGEVIPTGEERAALESQRADVESQRADKAEERATKAEQRIAELEAALRRAQNP